jgi:hypothetical protein
MAYDSSKPVTGGSLVAADMRENFRALKEDDIVEGVAATGITEGMLADSAVAQAKLKTSTGSVNTISTTGVYLTLPGGEYGFYLQLCNGSSFHTATRGWNHDASISIPSSYVLGMPYQATLSLSTSNAVGRAYARQRYVTSSGEVFWIFILRDKDTKKILSMYQAPDHPCMGNGGKPLLVPHPFGSYDKNTQEIIVINPTDEEVIEMRKKCAKGEEEADLDLLQVIEQEYEIDEASKPEWPTKAVTVGLPLDYDEAWLTQKPIQPIKKVIPKPDYVLCRRLKLREQNALLSA